MPVSSHTASHLSSGRRVGLVGVRGRHDRRGYRCGGIEGVICTESGEDPADQMQDKYDTSRVEVELLILLLVAVATSAITAVVGAGGGLILLIVILQFVDPLVVPIHAVIQLFANSTRAVALRRGRLGGVASLPCTRTSLVGRGYLLADGIRRMGAGL